MADQGLEPQTGEKKKTSSQNRSNKAKTEGAFRTIGEVAEALDLPQHVLRFWEKKFHQIRPVKRSGGRRYYRVEDVALLTEIRALLHEQGYTIRGVQKLLREGGLAKAVKARVKAPTNNASASAAAGKNTATNADGRQTGLPFDLLSDIGNMRQAVKLCLNELSELHAEIMRRSR
jgi:DNA-binding transcriptional MerR regulator